MEMENNKDWLIRQNEPVGVKADFYESIFALGNGYMGSRGFNEEEERQNSHELCVYIAGVFDYFNARLTDMVNTPNIWKTNLWINGHRLGSEAVRFEDYEKELDMAGGVLTRRATLVCSSGERLRYESIKCLHLQRVHTAFLSISLTPLNFEGMIEWETGIDTRVSNRLVQDDQMLNDEHVVRFLSEVSRSVPTDGLQLVTLTTKASNLQICEGFAAEWQDNGRPLAQKAEDMPAGSLIGRSVRFDARRGHTYTLNKYISVWTSRDCLAEQLPAKVSLDLTTARSSGPTAILDSQRQAWAQRWLQADIVIQGDPSAQRALRFNIFQLIQTGPADDPGVSIGARGIMHSRYKGCYFWDTEIFMLPFYLQTQPAAARNLLLYRYRTIEGARFNARVQNLAGARYPWMSALDGKEQCESWDIGFSEIHIVADIAYAINQYFEYTGDRDFMRDYGLEMLIETARYWVSRFTYDAQNDCYNLLFVKGPNEYGGVTINNSYTVMLALHNLRSARRFAEDFAQTDPQAFAALQSRIGYHPSEKTIWQAIESKAVIPNRPDQSLILEDELYLKTQPIDLRALKTDDEPLYKKICFDRLQRYRVLKQADVILLMLLLPEQFSREQMIAAWQEYEPKTTHDSSLSFGTHAEMAALLGLKAEADNYFSRSVGVDLDDRMANTGREGLHFASMGASWQAVVKGFAGCRMLNGRLNIDPQLPASWQNLTLRLQVRGVTLKISITHLSMKVTAETGVDRPLTVILAGKPVTFQQNASITVDLTV